MTMTTATRKRTSRPASAKWRKLLRLIPGYDPFKGARAFWFDAPAAQRALDFFHECLKFIEGDEAGKPFKLEPWQQSIVANLFGWKRRPRSENTRRYREALIYVPRKNGKTPLCAGLVNYVLFCDSEPGAQIYSAAAEREQAALVFRHAAGMIEREPELASRAKVYRTFKSIERPETNSIYKALSADADTKHGFNAHLVVVDELHAHPNGELVDVLITGTASRRQPLVIHITTADYGRPSVCNKKHDYACKVRDGIINDPAFLPVIYEASLEDDWRDETVWARVNPNLGISVSLDYLRRECQRAQDEPSYENTFKRLHLNIVTEQDVRWLSMDKWDACSEPFDLAQLAGEDCVIALDLSTTTDLTAAPAVFRRDDSYIVLPQFFVPGDSAIERERRDRVPYPTWIQQGFIRQTSGNVVDYEAVRLYCRELRERYNVREIAIDPWNAMQLATQLQSDGFNVVMFRQGYASMSAPSKELEKLILGGKINHLGNPVLKWMASNVTIETDAAGNIKPSKAKSTERIDGIVAVIMALGRYMVTPENAGKSIYETRDLLVIGA